MSVLLSGGMVTTATQSRLAAVRSTDGRIVEIGDLVPRPGEEVIDCSGCLVLPGGIETHSHLDLEAVGTVTADDFASGTRSALAGGTTTVLDFGTQFHGESLAEGLARWHDKARGQAVTDYGFHLAMTQWRPEFADEMAQIVAAGITSFKLYMAYRGSMMVEDDEIYAALSASSRLGATIGFHCENGLVIDALVREELARGHTGTFYHQRTRPPALEREAFGRLTTIAELLDAQHYIVHLSAGETIEEVRRARQRGSKVVAETCPQYLLLDDSLYGTPECDDLEARQYVMSPPLRAPENLDALWAGLADGDIQFVGTDHCSFNLKGQKDQAPDFARIPNGAPGIELRLALLYTYGVAAGRISPERFVAVTAENAARYFGLYPRKGTLLPGSDADIVVNDPKPSWTVRHDVLHDNVDHTPYEGRRIQGRVRDVFLRGHHVVADGVLAGDLAPGEFVPCGLPDSDIT
ncbi:MAG: dihydropyrimidinase [Dermatophilaceae bacterium]|nr:dihydropyrimidinase [Dermatophilaceae bacterium]